MTQSKETGSKVKRWDVEADGDTVNPDGDWARYEDCEAAIKAALDYMVDNCVWGTNKAGRVALREAYLSALVPK